MDNGDPQVENLPHPAAFFTSTQKGKKMLTVDGYGFRVHRIEQDSSVVWRCMVRKGCGITAKTSSFDDGAVVLHVGSHTHEPPVRQMEIKELKNQIT